MELLRHEYELVAKRYIQPTQEMTHTQELNTFKTVAILSGSYQQILTTTISTPRIGKNNSGTVQLNSCINSEIEFLHQERPVDDTTRKYHTKRIRRIASHKNAAFQVRGGRALRPSAPATEV
jgi:hypothetical protein